jgi:CubicO group peptidase (beta-lactamase class C family)
MDEPRRHSPGVSATARTIWHGGMSTSVCWADRDTGLAFAYLTNGLRRDKFAAITRRDLSDAVRSTWSETTPLQAGDASRSIDRAIDATGIAP